MRSSVSSGYDWSLVQTLEMTYENPRKKKNRTGIQHLVGGFVKSIGQLGLLFPIYGKIKDAPNHQPDTVLVGFHTSNFLWGCHTWQSMA